MNRLFVVGFSLLLALPAFADRAMHRAMMEESVRIQENRIKELSRIAESDGKLARELFEHARFREESAGRLEQKSRDFQAAANEVGGEEKRKFMEFAGELDAFARKDREFAVERKRAAEIIQRQADDAARAAEAHIKHLERMRDFVSHWR